MKSVNFKRKDSSFRSIKEEKTTSYKKINWDRVTYFIILCILLFFIGRFIFNKYYYVKADGQILFKNIDIQNLDDCRILHFNFDEGDLVCEGDTLFTYLNDDDSNFGNGGISISTSEGKGSSSWIEREIADLEKKIALNSNEINQKNRLEKKYQEELKYARQEVMLDALPKSVYNSIENKISDLLSDIDLIKGENQVLINSIAKLKQQLLLVELGQVNVSGNFGGGSYENGVKVFLSPMEGTVTRIFKQNNEVAIKSEVIMYIHKNEKLYVKAFFEQEDVEELKEDDIVEIEFPDGSTSLGTIQRFYFATYRLPEEFQKKYEPTTRSLSVDIVPLNNGELAKWKQFYKMSVVVKKKRF